MEPASTKPQKEKKKITPRSVFAFFIGFIVLGLCIKVFAPLIGMFGALVLGAFGVHVHENRDALLDLEAAANIFGFIGGLYVARVVYKKINKPEKSSS